MLAEDAKIAVVAPSGIFDPGRLVASKALVASWGYQLVEAPNLHARYRRFAGTVTQRRDDLAWAMTDPEIDAVWFARGGWGTMDLLDGLPWSAMEDSRLVLGFSDATALLSAMDRYGLAGGVHGPVLHSLADHVDDASRAALRRLLAEGDTVALDGRPLCGPSRPAQGRVIGGNLTVLASLAGTPWAMRAHGAIVVLEDVGEPAYRIDRALAQLIRSGGLDGAVGVGLGEFSSCRTGKGADWTLEDMLVERLRPLNIPVVAGLPVGHGSANVAWGHGAPGLLSGDGLYVG